MQLEQKINTKIEQVTFHQRIQSILQQLSLDVTYKGYDSYNFQQMFKSELRKDLILYIDLEKKLNPYLDKIKKLFSDELLSNSKIAHGLKEIENNIQLLLIVLSSIHLDINDIKRAEDSYKKVILFLNSISRFTDVLKRELETKMVKANQNENDNTVLDEYVVDLENVEYPNREKDEHSDRDFQTRSYSCNARFNPEANDHQLHTIQYLKMVDEIATTSYGDSNFVSLESPTVESQPQVTASSTLTTLGIFSNLPKDSLLDISKYLNLSTVAKFTQALGKTISTNQEEKSKFFQASLGPEKFRLIAKFKQDILVKDPSHQIDNKKLYLIAENFYEYAGITADHEDALKALNEMYFATSENRRINFIVGNGSGRIDIIKNLKNSYKIYLENDPHGKNCLLFALSQKARPHVSQDFFEFLQVWTNIQISPAFMKYVLGFFPQNRTFQETLNCSYENFTLLKSRLTVGVPKAKSIAVKLSDQSALKWLNNIWKCNDNRQEQIKSIFNDSSIHFNKKEVLETFVIDALQNYKDDLVSCICLIKQCPTVPISKEFLSTLMKASEESWLKFSCKQELVDLANKRGIELDTTAQIKFGKS